MSRKITTFATAFEKTPVYSVPWMSGLVYGLQNRPRRFESATHLAESSIERLGIFFIIKNLFFYYQELEN